MMNHLAIPITAVNENFLINVHEEDELLSNIIRISQCYSRNDLIVFKAFIKEGDYILDIGANIGWHTVFAAKVVGETGKVIFFETGKKNFGVLQSNITLNKLNNVIAVNEAITDFVGKSEMYMCPINYGDNIVCSDNLKGVFETIQCNTIDNYIKLNNIDDSKIKLIKMDIQGSECKALDGMKGLIKSSRPVIVTEYSPRHLKLCGSSPFDFLAFIDKYDYTPYIISEDRSLQGLDMVKPFSLFDFINYTQNLIKDGKNMLDGHLDILLVPHDL